MKYLILFFLTFSVHAAKYVPVGWTPDYNHYIRGIVQVKYPALLALEGPQIDNFCPGYKVLDQNDRASFWGHLLHSIAIPESSLRNASMYWEFGIKAPDRVTGKSVIVSEGLLQLSYADSRNYGKEHCPFDFEKDKEIFEREYVAFETARVTQPNRASWTAIEPNRTILDPYNNLHCGLGIMHRLLTRTHKDKSFSYATGRYWSVMRPERASYKRVRAQLTALMPACNVPGGQGR